MNCSIEKCNIKHYAKGLCRKHYYKEYNQKNKERNRKIKKKWMKSNPDYMKEYRENDIEKIKSRVRKYNREHSEEILKNQIKRLERLGDIFDMSSSEYLWAVVNWSKTIKKLDNNMCKLCDSKENLHAHHIYPKAEFSKSSLDIDNGITLCTQCHSEIHGFEVY